MADPFISELLAVAQRNMHGNVHSSAMPIPLIASGGWCAPSETIWDLHDVAHGMLDLPSVSIRRGGVKFHTGPRVRPLPRFEDCPSFGPPIGMLKPLELGIFIS